MKRFFCTAIALSLTVCAVLSGCGEEKNNQNSEEETTCAQSSKNIETSEKGTEKANNNSFSENNTATTTANSNSTIDVNSFVTENGFKYYTVDGKKASTIGIDVSSFNTSVDWNRVKASGVDFVMVRLGGRGYGENGKVYADDKAVENLNGAKNAGLKIGGYFFSQATNSAEAVEEAEFVKTTLGSITPDFPIAYDLEKIKDDESRTDKLSTEEANQCARAFCDKLSELGYKSIVYTASKELSRLDTSQLSGYDIWYCEYAEAPSKNSGYTMWQYSESGSVDGIDGSVDLNICFTSY